MQVISSLTGELADCTIATGVAGQGAIADVDLFAAFNVELPNGAGDLWEVYGKGGFVNRIAQHESKTLKGQGTVQRGSIERINQLAAFYAENEQKEISPFGE